MLIKHFTIGKKQNPSFPINIVPETTRLELRQGATFYLMNGS